MRSNTSNLDKLLPLTPRMLHVFLALLDGPRHGYAIMKDVEACPRGLVKVGPGTLYEALQSLEKKGFVEIVPTKPGDDPRRRYNKLTPLGRQVLEAEASRLEDLVRAIRAKNVQVGRLKS